MVSFFSNRAPLLYWDKKYYYIPFSQYLHHQSGSLFHDHFWLNLSRPSTATGTGLILGAGTGYLIGESAYEPNSFNVVTPGFVAAIGAAAGAFIGIIIGSFISSDKKIQIEGKSETKIKEILEELRKKARVPDFQ